MRLLRNRTTAVVAGATAVVALSATGSVAGQLIGSGQIADDSVRSIDVKNGGVKLKDLSDHAKKVLSKEGADGKDGVTNLIAGAGYTTTWEGDSGASLQTVREECPAGQYALGGGWSTWGGDKDLGGDNKDIVVTVSAPYFEGEYQPVDEAGNFRPTEWVVKGFNLGDTDQIVRAWVTCADVN
jgi:hypothetical protein